MTQPDELIQRVSLAMEDGRLHDGLLMQVPANASIGSTRCIAARVREDIFDMLERESTKARITSEVIGRENRNAFWVLGYQAAYAQYRLLLPLVGPTVSALIEDVRSQGLKLLMHTREKDSPLEVHVTMSHDMYGSLRERHQPVPDLTQVLREQSATIAQLLDPGFLARIPGLPVPRVVSVASVLPPEMDSVLDRLVGTQGRE